MEVCSMKSRYQRGAAATALCSVGLAIALMAHLYFRYISEQVYEECTGHLVEVYSQVNRSFISFLEKNWGTLDDWIHHIQIEDEEGVVKELYTILQPAPGACLGISPVLRHAGKLQYRL